MRRILFYCLGGALFILMAPSLWAVDDKSDGNEVSKITLDEAAVTAKREAPVKAEEEYIPLASHQCSVTPDERARTSDTAALLYDIPGVSLQQNGGVTSLPYLHGLGDDRVRIKVNGMDLISACPNHMNPALSFIDPSNVDTVKVMAGITPVSMGGDSIGGTILVDAAAPMFATSDECPLLQGRVGSFYRSNGNVFGANISALAATELFSLRYTGSIAKSGNYDAADSFKPAGPAALGRGFLDGDEVGSSRYRSENHAIEGAFRMDNHLLQVNLGFQHIPYEGFPNQRMDMTYNFSEQFNVRDIGQYQWGTLELRAYNERTFHHMDFSVDKQFIYGSAAGILAPGMPMITNGWNMGALVKADIELSRRDILRVGIEAQRYRLNDWWPPSPSVLPPGFTTGGMAPYTFVSINDGRRDRIGGFTEWEARWNPQWISLLGVRGETVMMDTGPVHGYNNGMMYNGPPLFPATTFNARDRHRTDGNFDMTALLRYTPKATQDYEVGYARKTRSPNLYERYAWSINTMAMEMINFAGDGNYYVGNLDLDPEVANTISATANWHDPERTNGELRSHLTTPTFRITSMPAVPRPGRSSVIPLPSLPA